MCCGPWSTTPPRRPSRHGCSRSGTCCMGRRPPWWWHPRSQAVERVGNASPERQRAPRSWAAPAGSEGEDLEAVDQQRPQAWMVLVLVQQVDVLALEVVGGVEGVGAGGARPGDLIPDRGKEPVRAMVGLGQLADPGGASTVEDQPDLVAGLFEFLGGHHGVD